MNPKATLSLLAALCVTLSACAQTALTPQAKAPVGDASGAVTTPSRAADYVGHFESDCQQLGDAFYTRDLVDLAASGSGIQAGYAKAIHEAEGCTPASLIVVFHMPDVQWAFDGTTQAQGRTVDRIQTTPPPGGKLTASHARAGWVEDTPTQFLLRRNGQGKGLPVDKAVEQVPSKELRLVADNRLYTSAADSPPDTYPTELDLEGYLERKPAR